jgi:hypothetical protein
VVVAVGLTLVEPLADVDVNVPGVMAILVAPVVAQLSVLLEPEAMLVGLAVKEVIVGAEPFPDEFPEPQPATPAQANRMSAVAQRYTPEECGSRELRLFLQNERGESMRSPFVADDSAILANTVSLQPADRSFNPGIIGTRKRNKNRASVLHGKRKALQRAERSVFLHRPQSAF